MLQYVTNAPKTPYTDLCSTAVTLSKAMDPESCTGINCHFVLLYLNFDYDIYHLIIVYLFIKPIKLASVVFFRNAKK